MTIRHLQNKMGFKKYEDWYNITRKDIISNGGLYLLDSQFNGSPAQLVMGLMKEHKWRYIYFNARPLNAKKEKVDWDNNEVQLDFMKYPAPLLMHNCIYFDIYNTTR